MATPFIDTQTVDPDEGLQTGVLGSIAASILMQVLYVARLARFDLLKAIAMVVFLRPWAWRGSVLRHRDDIGNGEPAQSEPRRVRNGQSGQD